MATRVTTGTPVWGFGCDDQALELSIRVEFPIQGEGAVLATAGTKGLAYRVTSFNLSAGTRFGAMTESSGNLNSGTLDAEVKAGSRASGVLNASWSKPALNCDSGSIGDPCAEGSLYLTFNLALP